MPASPVQWFSEVNKFYSKIEILRSNAKMTELQTDSVPSTSKTLFPKCQFCRRQFTYKSRVDPSYTPATHFLVCPEVAKKEPERACAICAKKMPYTRSHHHEVTCYQRNAIKNKTSSAKTFTKVPVPCPNCKTTVSKTLGIAHCHLARCLPTVQVVSKTGTLMPFSQIQTLIVHEEASTTVLPAGSTDSLNSFTMDEFVSGTGPSDTDLSMVPMIDDNAANTQSENSDFVDDVQEVFAVSSLQEVNMLKELGLIEGSNRPNATNLIKQSLLQDLKLIQAHFHLDNEMSCAYCGITKGLNSMTSVFNHAAKCSNIRQKLDRQQCRFCNLESDQFDCLIHEASCQLNPERAWHRGCQPYRCYNCLPLQCLFKDRPPLITHLGRCISVFKECTIKSLEAFGAKLKSTPEKIRTVGKRRKVKKRTSRSLVKRLQCRYCKHSLSTGSRCQERRHAVDCKGIAKMEAKRACRFCDKKMPLTKSYLHENLECSNRKKIMAGVLQCIHCDLLFSNLPYLTASSQLLQHLVRKCKCLSHIGSYLPLVEQVTGGDETHDNLEEEQNEVQVLDANVQDNEEFLIEEEIKENKFEFLIEEEEKENKCEPEPDKGVIPTNAGEKGQLIEAGEDKDSNVENKCAICPFCEVEFTSEKDLKEQHPIFCKAMKQFEPLHPCAFCNLELPFSLSKLHGLICRKTSTPFILTPDNLTYADTICPECQAIFKAKDLPRHLSVCLKILQSTLKIALENPSLSWNKGDATGKELDFIGLAGLNEWLKD